MRARDIRFKGTDDRLLAMAEHLNVDLAPLDARTLAGAVADAMIERGIPDSAEARELFAELLRADAQEERRPVRLSPDEELKRRRLLALSRLLVRWALKEGADLRRGKPSSKNLRGLNAVFREMASEEGAKAATVKSWCLLDSDALALIDMFRPVESPAAEHPLQAHWLR